MSIKRYHLMQADSTQDKAGQVLMADGRWVQHDDHLAEVERLNDKLTVRDAHIDALKDDLAAARAERDGLAKALAWYGEQTRLARLIHSEGDAGRRALDADGGARARAALAALPTKEADNA